MDFRDPVNQGFKKAELAQSGEQVRDSRAKPADYANLSGSSISAANSYKQKEGISNLKKTNGLDLEEQYGLKFEERKR